MNQTDFDKLKVLANNIDEYVDAVIAKLIQVATANNHDMSECMVESGYAPLLWEIFHSHCKKCMYDIELEVIDDNVYFDLIKANTKCDR